MREVEAGSCLGQSYHEMAECSIPGTVRRGAAKLLSWTSRGPTLNYSVGSVPWESALEGKGVWKV